MVIHLRMMKIMLLLKIEELMLSMDDTDRNRDTGRRL